MPSDHPLLEKGLPDPQWSKFWSLDSQVVFLNHGSFGACPLPVLAAQQRWRDRLEQQPLRFFALELEAALDQARQELAVFLGADPADLVFVPNATTGINTVLRSLTSIQYLRQGDELLTTNHEYNACRNALNFTAESTGASIVVADIPFPLQSEEQILAAILEKVSPRTRLILVDHVTSQTSLIFPIARLVQALAGSGIEILVDGAHAPGMLPLNLAAIGATYYTGNCHKWLCAPKGAAFLYIQPQKQSQIRPLTISHGANSPRQDRSRFHLEFDWTGTGDPTPYLCIPEAIRFLGSLLPGGWTQLLASNHTKALQGRQILCAALQVSSPSPDALIGAMATVPLPENLPDRLYERLLEQYQLEVPIIPWSTPSYLIRISAQIYNQPAQYDYLAAALLELQAAQNP